MKKHFWYFCVTWKIDLQILWFNLVGVWGTFWRILVISFTRWVTNAFLGFLSFKVFPSEKLLCPLCWCDECYLTALVICLKLVCKFLSIHANAKIQQGFGVLTMLWGLSLFVYWRVSFYFYIRNPHLIVMVARTWKITFLLLFLVSFLCVRVLGE